MPTGYTAILEDKNWDLEKWLKEDLVRNYGICVSLRDEDALTQEEIIERLSSYYTLPEKPEELTEEMIEEEYKEHLAYHSEKIEKIEKGKIQYDMTVANLKKMLDVTRNMPAVSEDSAETLAANVVQFAISQLDMVKSEFNEDLEYHKKQYNKPFKEFEEGIRSSYQREVEYYQEKLQQHNNKIKARGCAVDIYKNYLEQVDKIMAAAGVKNEENH